MLTRPTVLATSTSTLKRFVRSSFLLSFIFPLISIFVQLLSPLVFSTYLYVNVSFSLDTTFVTVPVYIFYLSVFLCQCSCLYFLSFCLLMSMLLSLFFVFLSYYVNVPVYVFCLSVLLCLLICIRNEVGVKMLKRVEHKDAHRLRGP